MIGIFLICVAAFFILVWHSRLAGVSLGLPIAFLFAMLLQYLPGAFAHVVRRDFFEDSSATEIGLRFTAIGTVCFVLGVVLAQRLMGKVPGKFDTRWLYLDGTTRFAVHCYFGGWTMVIVALYLGRIPSLGAALDHGATIWILGVMIGILAAVQKGQPGQLLLWLAALSVYPLVVLIHSGFLSFGSTSVFVVMASLLMLTKRHVRAYAFLVLFSVICFLLFLSYYQNRGGIREAVWGGASLQERTARCTAIISDFAWFHSDNPNQLRALDERLNQSQFAGMAAQKIESRGIAFLHGRSIWEGLQALVPRALWPGKPIFAGSSQLIRDFTDFQVNDTTTFGVGQVMEFYINFGIPSLVAGFLLFGFAYGWIDRKAATALMGGEYHRVIMWFLLGIAMNAPLASISEILGNVAAAVVAGYGWHFALGIFDAKMPVRRQRRKGPAVNAKGTAGTVPAETRQGD